MNEGEYVSERYIPPTEEEIKQVDEFWDRVRDSLSAQENKIGDPGSQPSQDLVFRVGYHKHRLQVLECEHPSITMVPFEPFKCGECDRPLKFFSDFQIEELQEKARADVQ